MKLSLSSLLRRLPLRPRTLYRAPAPGTAWRSAWHAVWAPGRRLLRDLRLPWKVALVSALGALMLSYILAEAVAQRAQRVEQANRAVRLVHLVQSLSQLQQAAQTVARAAYRLETTGLTAYTPQMNMGLADEARWFDTVMPPLREQAAEVPALRVLLAELQRGHQAMQAMGKAGVKANGTYQTGAATLTCVIYGHALVTLRGALAAQWNATLSDAPQDRWVREGLVEAAGDIEFRMLRASAAALDAAAVPGNPGTRRATRELLAQVRAAMALAEAPVDRARAALPEQSLLIGAALRGIADFADATEQLVNETGVHAGLSPPEALAAAKGPLQAYARLNADSLARLTAMEDAGLQVLRQRLEHAQRETVQRTAMEGLALAVGGLLCLYLMLCTYQLIAGGLRELGSQLEELGRGNLAIRPQGRSRDEIGTALDTLAKAAAHMSHVLQAVTQGVAAVSHASREVAHGNAGLAGRTDDIRSAIGGVAEHTQAFAGTMAQCSVAVERTAERVHSMRIESQRSRKAVDALDQRMRELQAKSREIAQVVTLVEAVAHQTKLLSLNASVEAARAGEAGKGFAVVAQEVRSLATRSEAAARRIRGIVDASIEVIEEGGQSSGQAGQAAARAGTEIEAVDATMAEIMGVMRDNVSRSRDVLGIARDVQEALSGNARLVDQLADASVDLRDQGEQLKRSIEHFVVA